MFINGIWLSTLKLWQAYHHWNEFNSPHSARTPRNEYYSKPYRENSYTPRGDVDIWESESVRHRIGAIKHTYNHMTWSHDLVLGVFAVWYIRLTALCWNWSFVGFCFQIDWFRIWNDYMHLKKSEGQSCYINFNFSSFYHVNVLQFNSTSPFCINCCFTVWMVNDLMLWWYIFIYHIWSEAIVQ